VASARILFGILGFGIAILGLATAWLVDRLAGMALLVVGGSILILPFTRPHQDE